MPHDTHVYGEVNSKSGLKEVFHEIRQDVDKAKSRPDLTELHKRAGYLVTLTHSPAWEEKFGKDIGEYRDAATKEFTTTAHKINHRATEIGTDADYDETWGNKK